MRLLFIFLLLVFAPLMFSQKVADSAATDLTEEKILDFHIDISVGKDAAVTVIENIKVNALGRQIRHGIFRSLPLERDLNGKKQRVKYEVISVEKDGIAEKFNTENEGGFLKIYIGNKDETLKNGVYNYKITYRVPKQVGFFKNYDEIYWNVNGTFWDFSTEKISATIHLPSGAELLQNSCYTGDYNSKESHCTYEILNNNTIAWSASNLRAHENLTVAAGFKSGIVMKPAPPTFLERNGTAIFLGIVFLGLLIYFYTSWDKYGRDPQKPVPYPQFSAPQNLSPASIGYIKNGGFSNGLIAAALVDLAVKGFLKITENNPDDGLTRLFRQKSYTLERLKPADASLPQEEAQLLKRMFTSAGTTLQLDGDFNPQIEVAAKNFQANLGKKHDGFLNQGSNSEKLILPACVIFGAYSLSAIINAKISGDGISSAILLPLVIPFAVAIFYYFAKKIRYGFSTILFIIVGIVWIIGITLQVIINVFSGGFGSKVSILFLVISLVALLVYAWLIKKPSPEKLETLSQIEGFKMYMGAAENEQLKILNPPQMTPQVFEALLPYAMALGVEKIWGEKFAAMLAASAATYTAGWYHGGNFSAMNFGSSLNSGLSQSLSSASSAPSSSGSGSGGGGFSGGGGGGGGGGGW